MQTMTKGNGNTGIDATAWTWGRDRRLAIARLLLLGLGASACAGKNDDTIGRERAAVLTNFATGNELPGLTPDQAAAFDSGRDAFAEVEGLADGLGPVFNGE